MSDNFDDLTNSVESLDDLIDIDSAKEVEDVSDGRGIDYDNINDPHIIIKTVDLNHILKFSALLKQGISRFTVANSLGFEVIDGKLHVFLSDEKIINYTCIIDIINTDNFIDDFFALNASVLQTVAKVSSSKTVIYKKEGRYFAKLFGGDVELSDVEINKDQLDISGIGAFSDYGVLKSGFIDVVHKFHPMASSSPIALHRKVFFDGGAYAMFIQGACRYKGNEEFPKFSLGIKEMKMIYYVLYYYGCKEVKVRKTDGKIMFEGDRFSLVTSFDDKRIKKVFDIFPMVDDFYEGSVVNYVNTQQLVNIINMSIALPHSLELLEFNYSSDGLVLCKMKTKKSDSAFILHGDASDNRPLDKGISVQASLLSNLVRPLSGDHNLGIVVRAGGVGVRSGDYYGTLFIER